MRAASAITACCLLMACEGARPLYCEGGLEAGGLAFCLVEDVPPEAGEMVERIVAIIGDEVSATYGISSDVAGGLAARGTVVETISGQHIVYGCREIGVSGAYVCDKAYMGLMEYASGTITMHHPDRGCFGALLAHEILHSVAYYEVDGSNRHDTPDLFRPTTVSDRHGETVEERVGERIEAEVKTLCEQGA